MERLTAGTLVRPAIVEEIRKVHPAWDSDGWICQNDLDHFRHAYVQSLLEQDKGEVTSLERMVLESLREQDLISSNTDEKYLQERTPGQRVADQIAALGGSWGFIGYFGLFILIWIGLNALILNTGSFDPYPFILLNLLLSCLAAIQAPIIMMSQNRQEARDRMRSEHDYQINLKAELEIRHLHEKMDHLLRQQWERMMQIQEIQLELLSEIGKTNKKK